MVLGDRRMKITTLDIVANIGDVWRHCDFMLKMRHHQPLVTMKTQHCQRLPDRQAFNVWRGGEDKQ